MKCTPVGRDVICSSNEVWSFFRKDMRSEVRSLIFGILFLGVIGALLGKHFGTTDLTLTHYMVGGSLLLLGCVLFYKAMLQRPIMEKMKPNLPVWKGSFVAFIAMFILFGAKGDVVVWNWIQTQMR